ncbi:hypothetical protein [Roseomonas acroporae]|nr:hypothetical protein [Roseomonas acroporae]
MTLAAAGIAVAVFGALWILVQRGIREENGIHYSRFDVWEDDDG